MSKNKSLIYLPILLLLIVIAAVPIVFAQSAGTDTLEEGRIYYEANAQTGMQSHLNGRQQVYGERLGYGLSKKIKVGLGVSFSAPHDLDYPPELQSGVKNKFQENENKDLTAGGAVAYFPVMKLDGTDTFIMVYTNLSKDVKKSNDARFTIGGYALVGQNKDFGSRKGWNLIYEELISNNISFSAQWVNG